MSTTTLPATTRIRAGYYCFPYATYRVDVCQVPLNEQETRWGWEWTVCDPIAKTVNGPKNQPVQLHSELTSSGDMGVLPYATKREAMESAIAHLDYAPNQDYITRKLADARYMHQELTTPSTPSLETIIPTQAPVMSQEYIAIQQPYRGGTAMFFSLTANQLIGENPQATLVDGIRVDDKIGELVQLIKANGLSNTMINVAVPEGTTVVDISTEAQPQTFRLTLPAGERLAVVDGNRRVRAMLGIDPDLAFNVCLNLSGGMGFEAIFDISRNIAVFPDRTQR